MCHKPASAVVVTSGKRARVRVCGQSDVAVEGARTMSTVMLARGAVVMRAPLRDVLPSMVSEAARAAVGGGMGRVQWASSSSTGASTSTRGQQELIRSIEAAEVRRKHMTISQLHTHSASVRDSEVPRTRST